MIGHSLSKASTKGLRFFQSHRANNYKVRDEAWQLERVLVMAKSIMNPLFLRIQDYTPVTVTVSLPCYFTRMVV